MKAKYGNVVRFDTLGGHKKLVMLFHPNDIEKLLRNEGSWPERKTMVAFTYYRTHHKQDVFQGVSGLLTV